MKRLGRWIFGFRDDVDLNQRWWHRLIKVTWALFIVAAFGLMVMLERDTRDNRPHVRDVEVLQRLPEFVKNDKVKDPDPSRSEIAKRFVALEGILGAEKDNRIEYVSEYLLKQADCMVFEFTPEPNPKSLPPENVIGCADMEGIPYVTNQIVKYRLSRAGLARIWIYSGVQSLAYLTVLIVISANLYYRGLVYIICGPRKKAAIPSDAQEERI